MTSPPSPPSPPSPSSQEPGGGAAAVHAELAGVVREHASRLAASMVSLIGDFSTAEDLVQDAIEAALRQWPIEGIPEKPDAWLFTVARRRGVDLVRRQSNLRNKLAQLEMPASGPSDDRLRLIFTCCHPALARPAQVALTLRTVCGLTTAQIAAAFLQPETTVAQRLTRAKKKITDAGIPYRIPSAEELPARLAEVLAVIYLMFNEAYLSSAGASTHRPDLAADAEWLADLLVTLMPNEPEAAGLLALIRLHRARESARFGPTGSLILLQDQDRARWDQTAITEAISLLMRTARKHKDPGSYQLQAAIVACHAEAPSWEDTDWPQIRLLYSMLLHLAPSSVTQLQHAIAGRYLHGPEEALKELQPLAKALDGYPLYHATRAELLRAIGDHAGARLSDQRARDLTTNPAQQELLDQRLSWT